MPLGIIMKGNIDIFSFGFNLLKSTAKVIITVVAEWGPSTSHNLFDSFITPFAAGP
jgi:hypothetical protein